MTFKEHFQLGDCTIGMMDEFIAAWHDQEMISKMSLADYLGFDDEDMEILLKYGAEALAHRLGANSEVQYQALYFTWDDLRDQLEDLVQSILGNEWKADVRRFDYYYWSLKLIAPVPMDEALSEMVQDALGLTGLEFDHFVDDDCVDNSSLLGLLGKMTRREVSSSHADDDGVWIIAKQKRLPDEARVEQLIQACEKRLRKEIKSKRYPLVDAQTACHQLFGFLEALWRLGLIDHARWRVEENHFDINDDG